MNKMASSILPRSNDITASVVQAVIALSPADQSYLASLLIIFVQRTQKQTMVCYEWTYNRFYS